ncbi:interferon-induced very large GTPase 1 isoform X2 [Danio rerio]|uniref:Interferon-induced very large GTPase 1 isoform X2 n=1 Tax=Danio rerio TaxID=7955 RepID=A0A8M3AXP3_DANRE|nr:interferon-induced very large GTPase 1-like isoform X2 [Danio rerio]XP_017210382.1 interferon-induced very large GTPase 1-like isoform X2 [Danio rerio]|eukprot:XP_009297333.1 interferon-induced very large GTPase 1-like isoform X2 [Danio rerio]
MDKRDGKVEIIRRRSNSMEHPDIKMSKAGAITASLSDLRIVLLGKTLSENCRVGDMILVNKVFNSEASSDQVQRHRRMHKTVINVPHLLQPHLSDDQITQTVRKCVSLSYPGPHVIVLLLQHQQCSAKDLEHVEKVLNYFSCKAFEHTMVFTTEEAERVELSKVNYFIKEIIKKCFNKHYKLTKNSSSADLREKLETFVQTNGRSYLECNEFEDSADLGESMEQQVMKVGCKELPLTLVLFGNSASVQFGQDNFLFGEKQLFFNAAETSRIVPLQRKIAECFVSVINMTDLHETELYPDTINQSIDHLVKENEIHSFIFVLRLGRLTDADKTGLERLQRVFGEEVLQFVLILFTYEAEEERASITDDLKKNPVLEQLLEKCGGRYHTCNKMMNNQSEMRELMNKVEHLIKENQQCYSGEIYKTKTRQNYSKSKSDELTTCKENSEHITSMKKDTHVGIASVEETRLEQDKGKQMNEKIKDLFNRLDLQDRKPILAADVLQLTAHSSQSHESCDEKKLVQIFFNKLLMMNYSARYITVHESNEQYHIQRRDNNSSAEMCDFFKAMGFSSKEIFQSELIHPMDVQMAVFHHADGFLKQLMVTKLSQCQFALPLLVPDPETQQIEFPLWTFRQINKSWKIRNTNNETISQTQPIYKAQTPMVFFFRFGSVSSSKSQLMNSLINDKHNTFFHRNCPGSSRSRVLMDGVVEIAWFCPSGRNTDTFTDCVAFCNLHGDAGDHEKQWRILTEMASVNVLLLQQIDRNVRHAEKIQNLYKDSKPLICLFSEDESAVTEHKKGKYKIGMKGRSQSDVSIDLRRAINHCLSESSSTFRLEDVSKHLDIRVDEEDDEDCRRGRAAAQRMISLLEKKKLTEIKESFLPHQGKLWHQWSQKNKELHRLRGDEIETKISRKQTEMMKIREEQHESEMNSLIQLFLKQISDATNKTYFLKWLEIILNECTLSEKTHKDKQAELERISEDLQAAAFGLEHIMREIGQIYESCSSVKENKKDLPVHFSSLPSLAAEMMISGFPLELMDGDAAHVPLVWISAVLDQLVQKLGDQTRVFVLSVLGLQSSGKSTMLNAMFGLQFAVSAGRCTRGAFMQLVKVSEEMKTQQKLKFDYLMVVDTEGLRALELDGRSARRHDNELATFVVGLGNLTLINIFGENPSEMQDVLQIVVQAFMRMKKVKLDPICLFVHQNVSDVTAGEKNEEGRRRLQKTLNEMTKHAAEEEVYDAEHFSDVIRFDIEKDVKYFAQLWEGSPPMAPPNPNYCENIQELKDTIITHASKSDGMVLTHFKDRINDLWKALLNEQFVFSFRNSLEISAYRKLETEYSKWSWSLRSAMMEIENKLQNKIENEAIHEVVETDLERELKETSEEVEKSMTEYFDRDPDADILIQWKMTFEIKIKDVQENIVKETKRKLNYIHQQQDMKKEIDAQRTHHENTLLEMSNKYALKLKEKTNDEETLKKEFDLFWKQYVKTIIRDTPPIKDIDIMRDVRNILRDIYESTPVDHWRESSDMFTIPDYSQHVILKKEFKESSYNLSDTQTFSSRGKIKSFVEDVAQHTDKIIQSFNISRIGYNNSVIQQLIDYIKTRLTEHEKGPAEYVFKKEFFVDLVDSICKRANKMITDQQSLFKEANDPQIYVQKKREEYYSIFQKHCHGANSAVIFGEIFCQKLKEPIEQSVYKKTARDLADEIMKNCKSLNGNRSNLEKHILKTLAEEEDFDKYMNYIHNPRGHFESFIRDEVSRYIRDKFSISVLPKMKENIKLLQQKIMNAAHQSTEHVQVNSGDVGLWLKSFTQQLSDQLIFSEKHLSGVKHDDVDVNLLDVVNKELPTIMSDISKRFSSKTFPVNLDNKDRPDELLIDHFCQCCWVQCPFCGATCTNTIENHPGDHSVSFHLNISLNGIHYHNTTILSPLICTSAVGKSNLYFYPVLSNDKIPWEDYRRAGGVFADWSITPDLSELPYWKWFVCRFQKDLEKKYEKTFEGSGKIPDEWRKYTKQDATDGLDKYI